MEGIGPERRGIDAVRRELEAEYVAAFGREESVEGARARRREGRSRRRAGAGGAIVAAFLLGVAIGASAGAVVTALVLLGAAPPATTDVPPKPDRR